MDEEIEQALRNLIRAKEILPNRVDIRQVIQAITGKDIRVIDEENAEDQAFLELMHNVCTNFYYEVEANGGTDIPRGKSGQNRVSAWISNSLKRRLETHLGENAIEIKWQRYPRLFFKDQNNVMNYISIRAFHIDTSISRIRNFYISSKVNVDESGRHILVLFRFTTFPDEEDEDKMITYFTSYMIKDLSELNLKIKIEFNAGIEHLMELPTLRSIDTEEDLDGDIEEDLEED